MAIEIEIVKMSPKGHIEIPVSIRKNLEFVGGDTFAIIGRDDTIILKKIALPTNQDFENLVDRGISIAKKQNIKESDVEDIIHKHRGI